MTKLNSYKKKEFQNAEKYRKKANINFIIPKIGSKYQLGSYEKINIVFVSDDIVQIAYRDILENRVTKIIPLTNILNFEIIKKEK
jgi:hypothetical protein